MLQIKNGRYGNFHQNIQRNYNLNRVNNFQGCVYMKKRTKQQISSNMKKVKNKDSQIELILRQELWHRGLRYQKNVTSIMGKPDIVFKGKKIAVFCDSEFWHGYNWDERKNDIKSNKEFWILKIERNIERDKEVNLFLENEGWQVLRFWGKEITNNVVACADIIENAIRRQINAVQDN